MNMYNNKAINRSIFNSILCGSMSESAIPEAIAVIRGNESAPNLDGTASFYKVPYGGCLIKIEITGLPSGENGYPQFLGLHIHETGDCSNNFENTGMHYNPDSQQHPHHLGDLPPLLNNNGNAYMIFYDMYLELNDIINRSIIIHNMRDDFTTQPSGDSGNKIGCGSIMPTKRSR